MRYKLNGTTSLDFVICNMDKVHKLSPSLHYSVGLCGKVVIFGQHC